MESQTLARVKTVAALFPIEAKNVIEERTSEQWVRVLDLKTLRERGVLPWKMLVLRRRNLMAGVREDVAVSELECETVGELLKIDESMDGKTVKECGEIWTNVMLTNELADFRAVSFKWKLLAKFGQALDLECFPADHQHLYIDVGCTAEYVPALSELSAWCGLEQSVKVKKLGIELMHAGQGVLNETPDKEVVWAEKRGNAKALSWTTSPAHLEWSEPKVQPVDTYVGDPAMSRSQARYAHVIFSFTTKRSASYAILNVVVPFFLVTSSIGVAATLASADTRLQVTASFFAVGMALRFVSTSLLPRIGYATLLDQYVQLCLLFMVVASLESALYSAPVPSGRLAEAAAPSGPGPYRWNAVPTGNNVLASVDDIFWAALVCVWALMNFYYMTLYFNARAEFDDEDENPDMHHWVLEAHVAATTSCGLWCSRVLGALFSCKCCYRKKRDRPRRGENLIQPTCDDCEERDIDECFWAARLNFTGDQYSIEIRRENRRKLEKPSCALPCWPTVFAGTTKSRHFCSWRNRRVASGRVLCEECRVALKGK